MKKKVHLGWFVFLQVAVLIYTLSTICAKMAGANEFLSLPYLLWMMADVALLGVYAICWQQIIKKLDLSIAYMNKAIGLFWSLGWSALIFNEKITWKNIVGAVIIALGILVVNSSVNSGADAQDAPAGKEEEE